VGAFSLGRPWSLEAFAHADNSLGAGDTDFRSSTSPDTIGASAAVTWASARGNAGAPNDPPDLVVAGAATSDVDVPGRNPAFASSNGHGTLSNSFTLSGGGPDVDVHFAIDISGALQLMTDASGVFARTETVFTLEVDGEVVVSDHRPRMIGPRAALLEFFSEHLVGTVTLASVDADGLPLSHVLLLEADSESSALVSHPPTALLLVAGLLALAATRSARSRRGAMGKALPSLSGLCLCTLLLFAPAALEARYLGGEPPCP
jgi:hypothetical protein